MHTDGTDGLQKPAWAAGLLHHLGQSGPADRRRVGRLRNLEIRGG